MKLECSTIKEKGFTSYMLLVYLLLNKRTPKVTILLVD